MARRLILALSLAALGALGCGDDQRIAGDAGPDSDAGTDADSDADADSDTDTDTDSDAEADAGQDAAADADTDTDADSDADGCSGEPDAAHTAFDPEGGFGMGQPNRLAQSFTPSAGELTGVELYLCEWGADMGPHTVELRPDSAGFPADEVLATAEIDAPLCTWPDFQPYCAAFEATAVTPGAVYWIALTANAAMDADPEVLEWATFDTDTYPVGQAAYFDSMVDAWKVAESLCDMAADFDCYDFAFAAYGG
jgi:hypothetical protein